MELNNRVCDDSWDILNDGGQLGNVDTSELSEGWLNGFIQCRHEKGEPGCLVNVPRSFKFYTGRKDCTEFGDESYKGKIIVMSLGLLFSKSNLAELF